MTALPVKGAWLRVLENLAGLISIGTISHSLLKSTAIMEMSFAHIAVTLGGMERGIQSSGKEILSLAENDSRVV